MRAASACQGRNRGCCGSGASCSTAAESRCLPLTNQAFKTAGLNANNRLRSAGLNTDALLHLAGENKMPRARGKFSRRVWLAPLPAACAVRAFQGTFSARGAGGKSAEKGSQIVPKHIGHFWLFLTDIFSSGRLCRAAGRLPLAGTVCEA